ncbi:MAG: hypothetical protein EZS28_051695, partial [Streblomastix strix]
ENPTSGFDPNQSPSTPALFLLDIPRIEYNVIAGGQSLGALGSLTEVAGSATE